MNDSQKIEELLHYFRMEQKDFATKCGFDPTIISHIKSGKTGISKRVLDKILETFQEINKSWLMTGDGDMLKKTTNQSIIGNNNENCQNIANSNSDIPDWVNILLAEKDERIKEKDERIQELKEIIRELKGK
jgi:transcriptional regulator with XRE-family HTH domain